MLTRLFEGTVQSLARGLTHAAQRHEVLGRNLANLSTPGYKARDVVFEDHLRPLLAAAAPDAPLPPAVRAHEPRSRIVLTSDRAVKADGNTVDLDRQMARLAENSLFHDALTRILAGHFATLRQAISGRI